MKPWMGWTAALAIALAMTASSSVLACDQHAQAADEKDPKAVAANAEAKGCDKPCCAKKAVAEATKAAAPVAVAAANAEDGRPCDKPCESGKTADGKSCPKKAAAVAKAEPGKDASKAEPAPTSGANR